jgi:flagellar motor component MotA
LPAELQGFVHYAPNMLTSLGILGTFVGIVVGLIGFDVNAIDASIGTLLAGLKTAFITSLVGILLAILFKAAETSGLLRRKQVETRSSITWDPRKSTRVARAAGGAGKA